MPLLQQNCRLYNAAQDMHFMCQNSNGQSSHNFVILLDLVGWLESLQTIQWVHKCPFIRLFTRCLGNKHVPMCINCIHMPDCNITKCSEGIGARMVTMQPSNLGLHLIVIRKVAQ